MRLFAATLLFLPAALCGADARIRIPLNGPETVAPLQISGPHHFLRIAGKTG